MSSMDKMEVSRDTEFVASICSTHSHKHLGLGAGVAAVVKKGAASRMVARTTGWATEKPHLLDDDQHAQQSAW